MIGRWRYADGDRPARHAIFYANEYLGGAADGPRDIARGFASRYWLATRDGIIRPIIRIAAGSGPDQGERSARSV
jgi:hypothetical protein